MHEHRNTLQHIAGEDFVAFHQDLEPGSLELECLQEVFLLLDVLKTRSSRPALVRHRNQ